MSFLKRNMEKTQWPTCLTTWGFIGWLTTAVTSLSRCTVSNKASVINAYVIANSTDVVYTPPNVEWYGCKIFKKRTGESVHTKCNNFDSVYGERKGEPASL
jgi:hypothetical protein